MISAALPLQATASIEFADSSRIAATKVNLIALLGLIAAAVTDRLWRQAMPKSSPSTGAIRRILAAALFGVPVVAIGAGLLLRSTEPLAVERQLVSAFTAEALPLPEEIRR